MTALPEVLTFGCRLNSAESDTMRRHAVAAGLVDTVIVNSCAVTAEAERQAGQAIRRLKRENPGLRVVVTGCASHIDAEKFSAMAEVDGIIPNDVKLLPEVYVALRRGHEPAAPAAPVAAPRAAEGPMQRAFIQVQNGCDHRCTFCIIPFGRGASRSLALADIIREIRARVDLGFNEVVFTGVDIASYGRDLPEQTTLGAMTRQVLSAVPELQRLRLTSLDPAAIDPDLWWLLSEEPRFMPHWHLSLQSGDNMILKRMKRRHSREDVIGLCEKVRRLRPDMVFGADIIAGFPTETEQMFANTCRLVENCDLTWLHVFAYSAREGTPAAKMPQVHGRLRQERAEKLRELGEAAARRHRQGLVGQVVPMLVEKDGMGCTPQFAKLKLVGAATVGAIVSARCYLVGGEVMAELF